MSFSHKGKKNKKPSYICGFCDKSDFKELGDLLAHEDECSESITKQNDKNTEEVMNLLPGTDIKRKIPYKYND